MNPLKKMKLRKQRKAFIEQCNAEKMRRTWLIQRLQKPFKDKDNKWAQLSNAFPFGGGLVNGGLSKDAMSMIKHIFRFDYMGSSEFEWGAVPKALIKIANYFVHNYYVTGQINVTPGKHIKDKKNIPVYYICDRYENHLAEVMKRIQDMSTGARKIVTQTKEGVRLDDACGYGWGPPNPKMDACGWLELDNGFMFFTDKEMFDKTIELFSKFNECKDL